MTNILTNRFAQTENPSDFRSHKSYTNPLCFIPERANRTFYTFIFFANRSIPTLNKRVKFSKKRSYKLKLLVFLTKSSRKIIQGNERNYWRIYTSTKN